MDDYICEQRQIKLNFLYASDKLAVQDVSKILSRQANKLEISQYETGKLVELGGADRASMNRVLGLVNDYAAYQDGVLKAVDKRVCCLHDLIEGISTNIDVASLVSRLAKSSCRFMLAASRWRSCQQSPQQASICFNHRINSFFEELYTLSKTVSHVIPRIKKENFGNVSVMDFCILLSGSHSTSEIESICLQLFGRGRAMEEWTTKASVIDTIHSFMGIEEAIDAYYTEHCAQFPDSQKELSLDNCPVLKLPYLLRFSDTTSVKFEWFSSKLYVYASVKTAINSFAKYGEKVDNCKKPVPSAVSHICWRVETIPSMVNTAVVPESSFSPYRAQIDSSATLKRKLDNSLSRLSRPPSGSLGFTSTTPAKPVVVPLPVQKKKSGSPKRAGSPNRLPSATGKGMSTSGTAQKNNRRYSTSKVQPLSGITTTNRSNNGRRIQSASSRIGGRASQSLSALGQPARVTSGKGSSLIDYTLLAEASAAINVPIEKSPLHNSHASMVHMVHDHVDENSIHLHEELAEQHLQEEVEYLEVSHTWQDERDLGSVATIQSCLTDHTYQPVVAAVQSAIPAVVQVRSEASPTRDRVKRLGPVKDSQRARGSSKSTLSRPRTGTATAAATVPTEEQSHIEPLNAGGVLDTDNENAGKLYSDNEQLPANIRGTLTNRKQPSSSQISLSKTQPLPPRNTMADVPKSRSVSRRSSIGEESVDRRRVGSAIATKRIAKTITASLKRDTSPPSYQRELDRAPKPVRPTSSVDARTATDFQYCKDQKDLQTSKSSTSNARVVLAMPQGFTNRSMDALSKYTALMRPLYIDDGNVREVHNGELSVRAACTKLVNWWRRVYPQKLLQRRLDVRSYLAELVLDMATRALFISGMRQHSLYFLAREGAAVRIQRVHRKFVKYKLQMLRKIIRKWKRYRAKSLLNLWANVVLAILKVQRFVRHFFTKKLLPATAKKITITIVGVNFIRLRRFSILDKRFLHTTRKISILELVRKRSSLIDSVKMTECAVLLQKQMRCRIARHTVHKRRYIRQRLFESLSCAIHRFRFLRMRPKVLAAIKIQRFVRGCLVRKNLYLQIQATQIIGAAFRKYISKVHLRAEVRRMEKPYSVVIHGLNSIPTDLFSSSEVTVKVSVWWSQLLHIVSAADFGSIVATKKPNMVCQMGSHRIITGNSSKSLFSMGRSRTPSMVASDHVEESPSPVPTSPAAVVSAMPALAEVDFEDEFSKVSKDQGNDGSLADLFKDGGSIDDKPISCASMVSADIATEEDDNTNMNRRGSSGISDHFITMRRPTDESRRDSRKFSTLSLFSIDEHPVDFSEVKDGNAAAVGRQSRQSVSPLSVGAVSNINSDEGSESDEEEEGSELASESPVDEKEEEIVSSPNKSPSVAQRFSFFRGDGEQTDDGGGVGRVQTPPNRGIQNSESNFAAKLRQTLVSANPVKSIKSIRESFAHGLVKESSKEGIGLLPHSFSCNFHDESFEIPLCHGNTAIRFDFIENGSRKVGTYTYFMSRHGKVVFKDGHMEGRIRMAAQNRIDQMKQNRRINDPRIGDTLNPLFNFTICCGLRSDWVYVRVAGIGPGKLALQKESGIGVSFFSEWKKVLLSANGNGYISWFSSRCATKPFYKFPMSDVMSLQVVPSFVLRTQYDHKIHDTQNVVITNTFGDTIIFRFREIRERRVWEALFKNYVKMDAHDPLTTFGTIKSKLSSWMHVVTASLPV